MPDAPAKMLTSLGGPRDADELLAGIRLWRQRGDDPELRVSRFCAWAKGYLREGPPEPGVAVAISRNTYITKFGSWVEALEAAGVLWDVPFDVFRRLVGSKRNYTDDQMLQVLREASSWPQAKGEGRPLVAAIFGEYRESRLRASFQAQRLDAIPSASAITRRFGSLPEAMRRAGVIDDTEAARRRCRRGASFSDAQLGQFAARAVAAHGPDVSKAEYLRFRGELIAQTAEPVPTAATFVARLGASSFSAAIAAALEHIPESEADQP